MSAYTGITSTPRTEARCASAALAPRLIGRLCESLLDWAQEELTPTLLARDEEGRHMKPRTPLAVLMVAGALLLASIASSGGSQLFAPFVAKKGGNAPPTVTPTLISSGEVTKLDNHWAWTRVEGSEVALYVAGEVQNNSPQPVHAVTRVEVREDNLLIGASEVAVQGYLQPGGRACFVARFVVDGAGVYTYSLGQPGYWSYEQPVRALNESNVLMDTSSEGQVAVSGTLANTELAQLYAIRVATTLYSNDMRVLDCNLGSAGSLVLESGGATTFSSLHNRGAPYAQANNVLVNAAGIMLVPHTPTAR